MVILSKKQPAGIICLVASMLLSLSLAAIAQNQPKSPEKSERKDTPQVRDLSYSRTYPFRMEKNPTVSSVVFNYVYEKLEPNANRHAYNEALQSLETYLLGLVSSQNAGGTDEATAKKAVQIEETTSGAFNQPRVHSIRDAVKNASKNKRFVVEIRYSKETVVVQPDGTKTVRQTAVKTERQTFTVSGGPQSAHIEIHCNNCDAVDLADDLFSLN